MGDEGAATLLKEFVPPEFQSEEYIKPWLDKPINDKAVLGDVFKKLVNAQQLIGKRPAIPAKDAPEAEWNKFLEGLRPDRADDYEIILPEGTKLDERGQAYNKALREAMLEAGIPKYAAKKFIAKMQAYGQTDQKEVSAKMKAAQEKAAAEFETAAKTAFGDKRDAALTRTEAAIAEFAPAAFKPALEKLTPEVKMLLAGVINGVMEKYVPADKLNARPGSSPGGDGGKDEETTLDAEMKTLQASAILKDPFHAEYQKTRDRITTIAKRIVAIREERKRK